MRQEQGEAMGVLKNYFRWLQKDAPTGQPGQFPELQTDYQTSVPGIYCIGDLTGIPLIKLAAESGFKVIQNIKKTVSFDSNNNSDSYDIIICGAGPAGVAATIEAQKQGLKILLLEAAQPFNTIKNFPAGKPIYVTPESSQFQSALPFQNGTKESLLSEYNKILNSKDLPLKSGIKVESISQIKDAFTVHTSKGNYKSQVVIVAIGSSGNARRLNVSGENLEKVYNHLIDPKDIQNKKVMVIGGGDSALETAIALAENGNKVSLSYRKESFARPKEHNKKHFDKLVQEKMITPYFSSTVQSIQDKSIVLKLKKSEIKIDNDLVYTMLGTEIPITFFKRSKIKMEGEKNISWWIQLITMLLFFSMLYFGKAGNAFQLISKDNSFTDNVVNLIKGPFGIALTWSQGSYRWYGSLNFILGWLSSLFFIPFSIATGYTLIKEKKMYFSSIWKSIKYSYLTLATLLFTYIYVSSILGKTESWVEPPTYWYSLLYCTTMLLFGIRRMYVKPTKYVRLQTSTLLFIQIFFLFLLPFHLYEPFIARNFSDSWIIKEVFPQGKWSSFGLILFWPLNINDFGTSTFWTWFPVMQTFVILPTLIYFWGKGVYCGWICSCGGMAETLGDEYRQKAPHGPTAKKWENAGQVVLLFAFIVSIINTSQDGNMPDTLWGSYKFIVDIIFAGVLGLGIYFFYSGRFWCRYLCPLAALMHIYTKFSRFRIFSNKKRCISCNLCTKSCHMGIDVMNYANKGKPLDDIECVACSSCITVCPMDVLSFGKTPKTKSIEDKSNPSV